MNTFHFGQCGLEVGTSIRYIEWDGLDEARPRIEVASKTTATPLFGDKTKNIKLNQASRLAHMVTTGETLYDYMSMDMWETEEGVVLRDLVTDFSGYNGLGKLGVSKKPAHPYLDIHTPTVYSHLMTATDVVRSDIPEAIGYDKKSSGLWNDYLDGGEGAASDKNLSSLLMDQGWASDCCGYSTKMVAGFTLCKKCGGEATFDKVMNEGS